MRYFWIILLSCLVIPKYTNGQEVKSKKKEKEKVSGYLGKKNVVQLKGMFAVSRHPQKPLIGIRSEEYNGGLTLNKEFEFDYGRVITNRNLFELVFGISSTSLILFEGNDHFFWKGQEVDEFIGTPAISDKYFGLRYKHYNRRKGGLAPMGQYWGFNFNIHNYTIDMSRIIFTMDESYGNIGAKEELYKLENDIHSYLLSEFGISTGMNRMIGRNIILDYGLQFSLVQPERTIEVLKNNQYRDYEIDEYFKDRILTRLATFHLMKFYFSVGYLF